MNHPWDLFGLFIVLVSLMSVVRQKLLKAKRRGLIRTLEKHKSRVVTLGGPR